MYNCNLLTIITSENILYKIYIKRTSHILQRWSKYADNTECIEGFTDTILSRQFYCSEFCGHHNCFDWINYPFCQSLYAENVDSGCVINNIFFYSIQIALLIHRFDLCIRYKPLQRSYIVYPSTITDDKHIVSVKPILLKSIDACVKKVQMRKLYARIIRIVDALFWVHILCRSIVRSSVLRDRRETARRTWEKYLTEVSVVVLPVWAYFIENRTRCPDLSLSRSWKPHGYFDENGAYLHTMMVVY